MSGDGAEGNRTRSFRTSPIVTEAMIEAGCAAFASTPGTYKNALPAIYLAMEAAGPRVGEVREVLTEIVDADWPSVNGDNPVDRIKRLAQRLLDTLGDAKA